MKFVIVCYSIANYGSMQCKLQYRGTCPELFPVLPISFLTAVLFIHKYACLIFQIVCKTREIYIQYSKLFRTRHVSSFTQQIRNNPISNRSNYKLMAPLLVCQNEELDATKFQTKQEATMWFEVFCQIVLKSHRPSQECKRK